MNKEDFLFLMGDKDPDERFVDSFLAGDAKSPYLHYIDFRKGLVDTGNAELKINVYLFGGAVQNENGIGISGGSQGATLTNCKFQKNHEYTFGVSSIAYPTISGHKRFITSGVSSGYNDCGLIYRSTGKWAVYDQTNGWQESSITDPVYFLNSLLSIYIDDSGKWHIRKNGNDVFVTPNPVPTLPNNVQIGSGAGNSYYAVNITYFSEIEVPI